MTKTLTFHLWIAQGDRPMTRPYHEDPLAVWLVDTPRRCRRDNDVGHADLVADLTALRRR